MSESLPAGWAETELGAVLDLANGFAFKPSHWGKTGLPIIRIQNLNNPDAPFNYYSGSLPERVRVRNGDLLFAWSGTPGTSFGAHIWHGGDAWLNQHIFRVGFDLRLFDKSFLMHAINQNLDRYIAQAHGGAGLAHITKGMFEESQLQLAPLPEQKRIVGKLEVLQKKLGDCQKRAQRIPSFLRRFRQSVLAAACSGRLTASWREEHKKEIKSSVQVQTLRDSSIDRIVGTPDEWTWATMNSVCDPNRSICYGVIKLGPPHEHGVPCLRTSDVKPLRIDTKNVKRIAPVLSDQFARTILRGGEVLVNVRGTLGGVAVVPISLKGWNISREVAVVPVGPTNPDYIAYWIASLAAQNWLTSVVKGVAYSGINIEDLRRLPIALPLPAEQDEIVRRVKNLFALADKIEARYEMVKQQVDRLPQSILAKAFCGELVPTEAELAERESRPFESAERLLERIRATKPEGNSKNKTTGTVKKRRAN